MAESKTFRSRLLEWGVATLKYPLNNLRGWSEQVEATGKGNLVKVSREPVLKHTRSVSDKVFEVWRSPGRFTKNGYTSWVELPNSRIFLVDYTNYGDAPDTSHLVGVHMDSHDIA